MSSCTHEEHDLSECLFVSTDSCVYNQSQLCLAVISFQKYITLNYLETYIKLFWCFSITKNLFSLNFSFPLMINKAGPYQNDISFGKLECTWSLHCLLLHLDPSTAPNLPMSIQYLCPTEFPKSCFRQRGKITKQIYKNIAFYWIETKINNKQTNIFN